MSPLLFGVGLAALCAAGLLGGLALSGRGELEMRKLEAEKKADALGLEPAMDGSLIGDYRGVYVCVTPTQPGWRAEASLPEEVRLDWTLRPAKLGEEEDLRLSRKRYVVSGPDPDKLRQVMEAVDRALEACVGPRRSVEAAGHELTVTGTDSPRALLSLLLELRTALTAAWHQPWRAVARGHDLRIHEDGTRIDGVVDGVTLTIEEARSQGALHTLITAPVPGLPEGTTVVHEAEGRGPSVLADGFLSRFLHGRTSDPEALEARLNRPEVQETLLAILHGRPGSVLRTDQVFLRIPKKALPGELQEGIRDVVDLVRGLQEP